MKVNAILLKPLDGDTPGAPREFDKGDFERLRAMGAVRAAGDDDAVVPARDESAVLLEQFRHPVEGPKMLADMKASFESLRRDREGMTGELGTARKFGDEAIAARDAAIVERDAAIVERDAAIVERDAIKRELADAREAASKALADRDAVQASLEELRAAQPTAPRTPKIKSAD